MAEVVGQRETAAPDAGLDAWDGFHGALNREPLGAEAEVRRLGPDYHLTGQKGAFVQ